MMMELEILKNLEIKVSAYHMLPTENVVIVSMLNKLNNLRHLALNYLFR